jgi:hypothetical protein
VSKGKRRGGGEEGKRRGGEEEKRRGGDGVKGSRSHKGRD